MENALMDLQILLPFKVFMEQNNVSSIVIETSEGSYGLLPQRLDCVAALVPGILTYKTENNEPQYLAVDAGVLVKAGRQVLVSVRNAIGGADLGKLGEMVKNDFSNKDESEKNARTVTAKLESGFMYKFDKFRKQ
jgi:F-type H+-transporting ATPase subunit epsilon